MICGVCDRPWDDDRCHVVELTETEKAIVLKTTGQKVDRYIYCNPCWKLLTNRQQGAQFIAGSFRAALRAAGNPKAEEAGKKMLDFLLKGRGRPVS